MSQFSKNRFILPSLCALSLASPLAADEQANKGDHYQISDGSSYVAKDFYPTFSWEVTPQYFMFGQMNGLLTSDQVESISAKTNFICIEKAHAVKSPLKYAEAGAKGEIAAFKQTNPDTKALFYFNSAHAYPFTSYTKKFSLKGFDKYPELHSFVLKDKETGEFHTRGNVLFFDVLNPDFRSWWINTVATGVKDTGADGAFIDQMHGFSWLRHDRRTEVQEAMGDMMAGLKNKMPSDKILLGNNAHTKAASTIYPHLDAIMFEHYNDKLISKEGLLRDWAEMLRIAKDGKMTIFRIGLEYDLQVKAAIGENTNKTQQHEIYTKLSQEMAEFYLASYLIGAQPYSYFQYGWGWRLDTGSLVDHPIFHKPLGAPLAAYKRVSKDGWEFTREFERASVWVDTDKRTAKITWK